jgi:hypothetical protein
MMTQIQLAATIPGPPHQGLPIMAVLQSAAPPALRSSQAFPHRFQW